PGYGYARAPEALRKRWAPLIEGFLSGNEAIAGVVQLIDLRHGPTPDDLRAIDYLVELQLPVLFALTKADKLKPQQRSRSTDEVVRRLNLSPDQVVPVSVLSGEGIGVLRESLGSLLGSRTGAGEGEPLPGE